MTQGMGGRGVLLIRGTNRDQLEDPDPGKGSGSGSATLKAAVWIRNPVQKAPL